jgi:hypothetical protein
LVAQYVQNVLHQPIFNIVFPVSLRKKTLKKQKFGLLSFHEENTGGIQTQATKILRLANG